MFELLRPSIPVQIPDAWYIIQYTMFQWIGRVFAITLVMGYIFFSVVYHQSFVILE